MSLVGCLMEERGESHGSVENKRCCPSLQSTAGYILECTVSPTVLVRHLYFMIGGKGAAGCGAKGSRQSLAVTTTDGRGLRSRLIVEIEHSVV